MRNVNTIDKRRSEWTETELSNAIYRLTGENLQLKILFLPIFDPRSSIVKSVYDCRLSGVVLTCIKGYVRIKLNVQ